MGKKSTKENKTIYQLAREEAGLTRARASEALGFISESRLEKIESETSYPQPDEVLAMSKAYKKPSLCNLYCSHECSIGQEYVPEVKSAPLSSIVLEMLSDLNSINRLKERLIDITADGVISDDEIPDFITIQEQLDSLSLSVDALNLWVKETVESGAIDKEMLEAFKSRYNDDGHCYNDGKD